MNYSVVWTENAELQLTEAALYIAYAASDNSIGLSFIDKIQNETEKQKLFPERGFLPNDFIIRRRGYRGLIIGNYVAFYKVHKDKALVVIEVFASLKSCYQNLL